MVSRVVTGEEFILRAKEKHGDKYDYSLVSFVKVTEKVTIICPIHGEFTQMVMSHMIGRGCPVCAIENKAKNRTKSTHDFVKDAILIHGDTYDYSKVNYKNQNTKVIITCSIHGEFEQRPFAHLAGCGCQVCGREKVYQTAKDKLKDTHTFIQEATLVHNDKYDYSLTEYVGAHNKVKIMCKEHGNIFTQSPRKHLSGRGCPICAKYGFNSCEDAYVYLLKSEDMLKIGITNKSPETRASTISKTSPQKFEVIFQQHTSGEIAREVEIQVLRWLKRELRQPTEKFEGYSEVFYISDVTVPQIIDKIIELEQIILKQQKEVIHQC